MIKVLILVSVLFLGGCRTFDRKNIEANLWLIDSKDVGIYRNVEIDGKPKEEFYYIQPNPKLMRRMACMIDTDRQKVYDYLEKSCTCN